MRDVETGAFKIKLPDNLSQSLTANLPSILKICVDAQFFVTVNVNIVDKLINGSSGTTEYIHFINPNKCFLEEL